LVVAMRSFMSTQEFSHEGTKDTKGKASFCGSEPLWLFRE
jgi:hypothetical protein